MTEVRWQQRLENFKLALKQLEAGVALYKTKGLSDIEKQGLIQAFEFTHELAWKTLKDYFKDQGNTSITGSKDAIRQAFSVNLIQSGDTWMDMITSRNLTSHTYHLKVADEIVVKIVLSYFKEFVTLIELLDQKRETDESS